MKPPPFQTSIEAYHWCLTNGLITDREKQILDVLNRRGPMNGTMACIAIREDYREPGLSRDSIVPRFATLRRLGTIEQIGKQQCPITHRMTVFYRATTTVNDDRKPTPRETIKALRQEIALLRREVAESNPIKNLRAKKDAAESRNQLTLIEA